MGSLENKFVIFLLLLDFVNELCRKTEAHFFSLWHAHLISHFSTSDISWGIENDLRSQDESEGRFLLLSFPSYCVFSRPI